jgi:hypothetical protein
MAASAAVQGMPTLPKRRRTVFIASSRDDIDAETARLAAALRSAAPGGLAWTYAPRPDLTHGTIFRAVAPAALTSALR